MAQKLFRISPPGDSDPNSASARIVPKSGLATAPAWWEVVPLGAIAIDADVHRFDPQARKLKADPALKAAKVARQGKPDRRAQQVQDDLDEALARISRLEEQVAALEASIKGDK